MIDKFSIERNPKIGFASLRPVVGPKTHATLDQSNAKLKSITTWSPAFSRALGNLDAFI